MALYAMEIFVGVLVDLHRLEGRSFLGEKIQMTEEENCTSEGWSKLGYAATERRKNESNRTRSRQQRGGKKGPIVPMRPKLF